jgi:AraC family transcriptional regulator
MARRVEMEYHVEQGHQARQPYVAIRTTVSMKEIGEVMGPLYGELFGWLGARGIQPAGAPWTRYLGMGQDDAEMEVAAPVGVIPEAEGRIVAGEMASCDYVRTLHVGPYETIEAAYDAIIEAMRDKGLMPAGATWEVYLTDPETEPDPAKWETMVYCPVFGRSPGKR